MRRCSRGARVALLLGVALGLAGSAGAQPQRVRVEVIVSHISDREGEVDPRGQRLHQGLSDQFIRYNSLRVLSQRKLALAMDEVGTVELPSGGMFRVRPLDIGDRGLFMAVGVDDFMQMDMRVRSRKLVVIGGPEYGDGKLVIGLEPEY